jgi:tRNA-specific 2-thiouridylase
MYQAVDSNKDQTYFLYRTTAKALRKTIMPLGTYTKPQVRVLAKRLHLATANKRDSQGICFIGEIPIADFLIAELGAQPSGPIIDQSGKQVGTHDGAILYTIGQRHGLHVGGGLPYYVTGKHISRNEVFVTTDLQDQLLWQRTLNLTNIHWINDPPDVANQYKVCIRYRSPLVDIISMDKLSSSRLRLTLSEDVRAVTAGQSAVIYSDNCCIGGGLIV